MQQILFLGRSELKVKLYEQLKEEYQKNKRADFPVRQREAERT
jgi:hypothetical protein